MVQLEHIIKYNIINMLLLFIHFILYNTNIKKIILNTNIR